MNRPVRLKDIASERGYSPFLSNSHEDSDLELREIGLFPDGRANGLIVDLGIMLSEHF